jgi:glucans biosynthesis protein
MTDLTRRALVASLLAASASAAGGASAQGQQSPDTPPRFNFEDVVRRARDLATAPFDKTPPELPEALSKLDFDAWRDIRFRSEKAFLGANGSLFRLQLFHLGHLFKRPVIVNTIRDGIPTPIPYAANIFDYGRTKLDKPLPVNVSFAGFRLHYPLNDPKVFDEVFGPQSALWDFGARLGCRRGYRRRTISILPRILDRDA